MSDVDHTNPHVKLRRMRSERLPGTSKCPKFLIFIKPHDDSVFFNLMSLLQYIKAQEAENNICVDVIMPKDLLELVQGPGLDLCYDIDSKKFLVFTESIKSEVDYIFTLGGDGTLLWAAK